MAGGQTSTTQHSGQSISFDATVDGGTFSVGGNVGNGPAEFHHSGSASGPGTQVGVKLDGSPLAGLGGDLMLMQLRDKDLQNLLNFKKLGKNVKKAVKVGKDVVNVAKDAKHTYDDIRGIKLVNLNTDLDNRDAANRDHDFDLLNLDTELDYYHSDGKTSFTGNRNTRTHIKDVSMGRGSTTSFGLVNLEDLVKEDEANLVFLQKKVSKCQAMYAQAHTNPLFTKKTKKGIAFRTKLQEKMADCKKVEDLLM